VERLRASLLQANLLLETYSAWIGSSWLRVLVIPVELRNHQANDTVTQGINSVGNAGKVLSRRNRLGFSVRLLVRSLLTSIVADLQFRESKRR
jgi:hypothetical protein